MMVGVHYNLSSLNHTEQLPLPFLLVVVTAAFRTPLCKARKGGYKDTSSDELLLELFKAAKANIGIDAGIIGDM